MNDPERGKGGATDYLYDDWSDNDEGEEMNDETEVATERLKPCPFCGTTPKFGNTNSGWGVVSKVINRWKVWCPNCQASTDYVKQKEDAIAAWNNRQ